MRMCSRRSFAVPRLLLSIPILLCLLALTTCSERPGGAVVPQQAKTNAGAGVVANIHQATCVVQQTDLGAAGPYAVGALARRFIRASSTTGAARTLDTVIWYPAAASAERSSLDTSTSAVTNAPALRGCSAPIIFFSHGSDSTPLGTTFLITHLASMGFVVIAPHHPDAEESDASAATNRPADISFLIDQLPVLNTSLGSPLRGMLNMARIGIAGHSFGGYTAVAVAARDPRVSAALPMAPGGADILTPAPMISIPMLILAGDSDQVVPYTNSQQLYRTLSSSIPHGLLTLHGSDHLVFTDPCGATNGCQGSDPDTMPIHEVINRAATAFFLMYLAGDSAAATSLNTANNTTPQTTLETQDMP